LIQLTVKHLIDIYTQEFYTHIILNNIIIGILLLWENTFIFETLIISKTDDKYSSYIFYVINLNYIL